MEFDEVFAPRVVEVAHYRLEQRGVDQLREQVALDVLAVVDPRRERGALDMARVEGLGSLPLAPRLLVLLEVPLELRGLLKAVLRDLRLGHRARVRHLRDQRQRARVEEAAD